MSLRTSLSTPEGKGRYARRLFATIADRYDFVTVALSYGRDRVWKRRLVALAAPRAGQRALDVACGTGDLARAVAAHGIRVVGLDVTARMIAIARRQPSAGGLAGFVCADMMSLPFGDRQFDLVTSGYGLRNAPVLDTALREMHRVLKPGGRLCTLDFDRPTNGLVRLVYLSYLTMVGSAWGLLLHGDPDTYRYIPESIRTYPGSAAVVRLMKRCGFTEARRVSVLGGLMAIHVAIK